MWGNVLTVEPFDSDTAGEKGDGAEIGDILQLSIPGAGNIRRDIKQAAFPGFVGQQEPILKTCGTVEASLLGKLKN